MKYIMMALGVIFCVIYAIEYFATGILGHYNFILGLLFYIFGYVIKIDEDINKK